MLLYTWICIAAFTILGLATLYATYKLVTR